jgi:hypothetical protein
MNETYADDLSQDVSSVYLYVYSDKIGPEEIATLMPVKPMKALPKKIKVKYIWSWCSRWHYGNDVLPTLERFLSTDLPRFEPALRKLVRDYQARLELDLVIGVGNSPGDGMHNILFLPPNVIKELSKWEFDFRIYEDEQIGGTKAEIDAKNAIPST